jgi:hypothetical protein
MHIHTHTYALMHTPEHTCTYLHIHNCAKVWLEALHKNTAYLQILIDSYTYIHIHAHTYSPQNTYTIPTTFLQYMHIPTQQIPRIGRLNLKLCACSCRYLVTMLYVSCQYLVSICRYCKYVSVSMRVTFFLDWDTYTYMQYWQDTGKIHEQNRDKIPAHRSVGIWT